MWQRLSVPEYKTEIYAKCYSEFLYYHLEVSCRNHKHIMCLQKDIMANLKNKGQWALSCITPLLNYSSQIQICPFLYDLIVQILFVQWDAAFVKLW